MKTDTYTRVVLTIIAICLILIVIGRGEVVPRAVASSPELRMVPVNDDGSINVRIIGEDKTKDASDVVIVGWKNHDDDGNVNDLIDEALPVNRRSNR